ncbi:VHS-domain-containing protein [Conidiobolus coronatus NRRL 28638]|uniref:VHS-domain-containing protein n=1 Tax=Conidiobolus coronatus (strain ATCC 28846 / CBS 209.66 / NRRL 28638) TaxID=796925 RepID=A0A137P6B8_CONC2|nr:VHS-domain-containing protein [Conidiobolus coronatus NRRL 28638]|eukprot:KXN70552.1 VHS-domain-containing protein [Conidiobolus coronatus NRRL 28638]
MMIERACDPRLHEPDLALNLDICEYVNQKKQNIPFEVSELVVHFINNRDQKVAILALTLLDTLIRNCGYAFHLQISRKDFLNELVKKFPEQPPPFPNAVQIKILEFINEWKLALCNQPRYRQDFGKIEELHNILSFKGYRFPTVKPERLSTLMNKQTLSTADELEEADKEALQAKLQELIRRGTPADLIKANELMKVITGYDQKAKPDYQTQVARQLNRIEKRIEQLSSLLVPGVVFDRSIQNMYNECISAQSKIRKLIEDDEDESLQERLLTLNDSINQLEIQYQNARQGIFSEDAITFQNKPAAGERSTQSKKQSGIKSKSEASLIDLDLGFDSKPQTSQSSDNLLDSLEGLTFEDNLLPGFKPIQLGSTSNSPVPQRISPTSGLGVPNSQFSGFGDLLSGNNSNFDISPNTSMDTSAPASLSTTSSSSAQILSNELIQVTCQVFIDSDRAYLQFVFQNQSKFKIEDLDFKVAVPKSVQVSMSSFSSNFLLPQVGQATLPVELQYSSQATNPRYKYILNFKANGKDHSFNGQITH